MTTQLQTNLIRGFAIQSCGMFILLLLVSNGCAFIMPGQLLTVTPITYECSSALDMQSEENERLLQSNSEQMQEGSVQNYLSLAAPYNKDIARTLFSHFFLSLDRNSSVTNERHDRNIRRYPKRPCPFQDPSSAQTSEKMLHRMMENRYQSDGRTACPDATTFNLVAGAFGRLRYKNQRGDGDEMPPVVTWQEEPKVNPHHRSNVENSYNQIILNNESNNDIGKAYNNAVVMTPVVKLQELLQLQLQLCHYEGWPVSLCPSVQTYNRILKRLDNQMYDDAQIAKKIFHLMQSPLPGSTKSSVKKVICAPDAMTFLHVIKALSRCRPDVVPIECTKKRINTSKAAIQSIEDMAAELGIDMDVETMPSNVTIDWFLNEAEKVLVILREKHNEMSQGLEYDKVSKILAQCMSIVLERWGKYAVNGDLKVDSDSTQLRENAINRAHELLCCLEKFADRENNIHIPSSSYVSVILGLSVGNNTAAAFQAEQVLSRMMKRSTSANFDPRDVATAYSACIAAYAKNNDAPRAEAVLYQMIDLYDSKTLGDEFVPDTRAYGTCIAAWAKYAPQRSSIAANIEVHEHSQISSRRNWRQRVQNADNAEKILSDLDRLVRNERAKGNDELVVHATPYNIAIHARVQTVRHINKREYPSKNRFFEDEASNEEEILHAMSLLNHMEYEMEIPPDAYSYSILLNAWVQHSRPGNEDAADYAEELLRRENKGFNPEMSHTESEESIWPNVKHYSSVLKAHAKTKSAGGAKKALSLLSEMERQYSNSNVIPNMGEDKYDEDTGITYYIETRDAAKPDLICYSIVMDAFANSRLPEAGIVSYRLLGALESKYKGGDFSMKPNTRIYTAVIQSLIHSEFIGNFNDCEDAQTHQWINNAQVAMYILSKMKSNSVYPNAFTYNYIINCAAECKCNELAEARVSFEVAVRAFQEIRSLSKSEDGQSDTCPDSFTYAFMLKACSNHLPRGSALRTKTLTHTFQECCRAGYLNSVVLDRLYIGVASDKEFSELTGITPASSLNRRQDFSLDLCELPPSWSRNIITAKYPVSNEVKRRKRVELYK